MTRYIHFSEVVAMARRHKDTELSRRAVDPMESEMHDMPKKGDMYRCEECGMEMEITVDCHCSDRDAVRLECCGQDMARV